MTQTVALIPARAGSLRVPGKNLRRLAGHPLIAYSIWQARHAGLFARIVVSTESEDTAAVARHYGAEVPFLRPAAMAGNESPDVEWVAHALDRLHPMPDHFAILRPTSPFRTPEGIRRAYDRFLALGRTIDSIRAVARCTEHPYKMWRLDAASARMEPLFAATDGEIPYHSRAYQSLPEVYVQDSSLEIARSAVVVDQGTISGRAVAPFISEGYEGFSIDHETDWVLAEHLVASGRATLVTIPVPPYVPPRC